ncbi:MAG TPA: HypC/HybG/HupF family hydrogenase formation chaperone [Candidatus Bathyarchaeota archaeon]|nr:HypC/HybG/HupF family hydrogenase formation chaperone [Candidatus Bathyarchaeota archaeon]
MCLAVPAKVVEIVGDSAKVDFGSGVLREVNIALLEKVEKGNYVLVHAGYAIQLLDEKEAEETLRLWRELLEEAEIVGVEKDED